MRVCVAVEQENHTLLTQSDTYNACVCACVRVFVHNTRHDTSLCRLMGVGIRTEMGRLELNARGAGTGREFRWNSAAALMHEHASLMPD